jgi:hypothetical protein
MPYRVGSSMLAWCVAAWMVQPAALCAQGPERVTFDGQVLVLAFTTENPGESIREYIPEGEKLDSWTRLASIREYSALHDPKAVAANLVRILKQNNPRAPSSVSENEQTGEVMVDFVTWPPDEAFVEFNVWKYRRRDGGGLVAHQYALRDYRDPKGFLRKFKPVRERLVRLMAKGGLVTDAGGDDVR